MERSEATAISFDPFVLCKSTGRQEGHYQQGQKHARRGQGVVENSCRKNEGGIDTDGQRVSGKTAPPGLY